MIAIGHFDPKARRSGVTCAAGTSLVQSTAIVKFASQLELGCMNDGF
jgi:hypothetical protein